MNFIFVTIVTHFDAKNEWNDTTDYKSHRMVLRMAQHYSVSEAVERATEIAIAQIVSDHPEGATSNYNVHYVDVGYTRPKIHSPVGYGHRNPYPNN